MIPTRLCLLELICKLVFYEGTFSRLRMWNILIDSEFTKMPLVKTENKVDFFGNKEADYILVLREVRNEGKS